MDHASGETVAEITEVADSAYETALAATLNDQLGNVEAVVLDTNETAILAYAKTHITNASTDYDLPRYLVSAVNRGCKTTASAIAVATALDSDRAVVIGGSLIDAQGYVAHLGVTATAHAAHFIAEKEISRPLKTIVIQGFSGILHTWSQSELQTLREGGVCPLKMVNGVPTLHEDVTAKAIVEGTGKIADGYLGYLPQVRTSDYVERESKRRVASAFGRQNNDASTLNSLRKYVEGIFSDYAGTRVIPTGVQPLYGTFVDMTPTVSVSADLSDRTIVNVNVSYWVFYEIRTININLNLHN
jgi:hypothetical protein